MLCLFRPSSPPPLIPRNVIFSPPAHRFTLITCIHGKEAEICHQKHSACEAAASFSPTLFQEPFPMHSTREQPRPFLIFTGKMSATNTHVPVPFAIPPGRRHLFLQLLQLLSRPTQPPLQIRGRQCRFLICGY